MSGGWSSALLSGVLIATGRLEAGGWAIALAGVCDILDGRLARALGVASPYGKFIDSTLDRFVETFAFLGFAVYFAGRPWGPPRGRGRPRRVAAGELRAGARRDGGRLGLGRPDAAAERLVLQILGCLFDAPLSRALGRPEGTVLFWVLALMAVGAFGTAVHRTLLIARRLRAR